LLRALKSPIVGGRVRYFSSLDAATFNALISYLICRRRLGDLLQDDDGSGLRTPRVTPLT
jgi:hypothetical protein